MQNFVRACRMTGFDYGSLLHSTSHRGELRRKRNTSVRITRGEQTL